MKLFLAFLFLCSLGGMAQWKTPLKQRMMLLAGLCLLVCIGYYFLHQI